ncbi:MAG: endonuclease III [Coriobacteriia bacterium]|nr:endonuclease III [Coriobacteriia bacterium]
MTTPQQAAEIDTRLKGLYPVATIALGYETDFQLLIAVILSAQTTDIGVNKVTPVLFERFPTPEALAGADPAEIEQIVHSTGFFRNKTKNIIGAAQRIVAEYDGHVPDTMADLLTLPGVARKTANIVLYNAFGKAEGVAVDTHVFRLAHRLGYSAQKDTGKVERDLMALFPSREWGALTYRLIEHGRAICDARRPICGQCALSDICPSAFTVKGWREQA